MKTNMNSTGFQVIFQGLRTVVSIALIAGITVFFIQNGTGAFAQSWNNLAQATDILMNNAG